MQFKFVDDRLLRLYETGEGSGRLKESAYKGFAFVMGIIRDANTVKDLALYRGRNFEALTGDRKGQYSLRLDQQFRLVFTLDMAVPSVTILEITDYH